MKQSNLSDRVFTILEWNPNNEPAESEKMETEFRDKFGIGFWYPRVVNELMMLRQAITEAKSTDAKEVASKLEGMKTKGFDGQDIWMRKEDHQLLQNMYMFSFGPKVDGVKFDEEHTGWGWKTIGTIKAEDTVLPTTCKMDRP